MAFRLNRQKQRTNHYLAKERLWLKKGQKQKHGSNKILCFNAFTPSERMANPDYTIPWQYVPTQTAIVLRKFGISFVQKQIVLKCRWPPSTTSRTIVPVVARHEIVLAADIAMLFAVAHTETADTDMRPDASGAVAGGTRSRAADRLLFAVIIPYRCDGIYVITYGVHIIIARIPAFPRGPLAISELAVRPAGAVARRYT